MTGYTANSAMGRVVTGEVDTIWRPRTPRVGTCGVILLHGQSSPKQYMDTAQAASVRLAAALAGAGIPCVAAEMHGNSWATDQALTDMDNAWGVLKTAYPTMRTDKVCLLGVSMGAALGTRYAQLHPDKVAAMVGIIPAYDPKAIFNYSNVGDAAMEAAWSFTGIDDFPDALDLGSKAADASTVPLLTGYASDDTVVPKQSVIDYHTAAGGDPANLIDLGAHDHTDTSIGNMPIPTVAQFLVAHGA